MKATCPDLTPLTSCAKFLTSDVQIPPALSGGDVGALPAKSAECTALNTGTTLLELASSVPPSPVPKQKLFAEPDVLLDYHHMFVKFHVK